IRRLRDLRCDQGRWSAGVEDQVVRSVAVQLYLDDEVPTRDQIELHHLRLRRFLGIRLRLGAGEPDEKGQGEQCCEDLFHGYSPFPSSTVMSLVSSPPLMLSLRVVPSGNFFAVSSRSSGLLIDLLLAVWIRSPVFSPALSAGPPARTDLTTSSSEPASSSAPRKPRGWTSKFALIPPNRA